jgi:hypothetical protein
MIQTSGSCCPRRPPYPVHTVDYATYVQIPTWFLDTPSPEAPFSVHRMALAGKELGTDVGQWFGHSVAAGAIRSVRICFLRHLLTGTCRTLVSQFPECGLAVAVATDSTLYQSQVFTASHVVVLPIIDLPVAIICILGVTDPYSCCLGLGWASTVSIRFITTLLRCVRPAFNTYSRLIIVCRNFMSSRSQSA